MTMATLKLLLVLSALSISRVDCDDFFKELVGSRHENSLDSDDYYYEDTEDGENRFLFTSTSTVSVNSTLLRTVGAIIGALLVGLPIYLAYATAGSGGSSYSRYKRRKRSEDSEEWYSHMHILTESFRKYQISELGCQVLVACESGIERNRNKPTSYGHLTKTIHGVLGTSSLMPNETKHSGFVKQLLQAHADGGGYEGETDCQNLYQSNCQLTLPR